MKINFSGVLLIIGLGIVQYNCEENKLTKFHLNAATIVQKSAEKWRQMKLLCDFYHIVRSFTFDHFVQNMNISLNLLIYY